MMPRRGHAAALIVAILMAVLALPAGDALAHAVLVGSSPADGQELQTSPAEIELEFNEGVRPAGEAIRLLDAAGEPVAIGDATHGESANLLRAAIPTQLDDGTYVVAWAAVSSDGHTIRGSFVFAVGVPLDQSVQPAATDTPDWLDILAAATRFVAYSLALLLIGALAFLSLPAHKPGRDAYRRPLIAGAVLLALSAVAVLATEALIVTRGSFDTILDTATRETLRDGRHLTSAAIIVFGAIVALAATSPRIPARNLLPVAAASVAAITIAFGFAWSGHPVAGDHRWLGITATALHVLATGTWAAALLVLAVESRRLPAAAHDRVQLARAFSRIAIVAFPLAVVSGIYLAYRTLPAISDLTSTDYGQLLLAKILLVAAVAVLAAINRRRLLRQVSPDSARPPRLLRLVGVELAAAAIIVALTATLAGQSPTPAQTATPNPQSTAPLLADAYLDDFHAILEVSPGRQGDNDIAVELHALDQSTDPPLSVELILTHPATETGPFRLELQPTGGPRYEYPAQSLPLSGDWTATLAVRVSDFEQQRQTLEFTIP